MTETPPQGPPPDPPGYEPPDIAWEEDLPPATYGASCHYIPSASDACNASPNVP